MNGPENSSFFLSLANIQHPFGKRCASQVFLGHLVLALIFIKGDQINLQFFGKHLYGMDKSLDNGEITAVEAIGNPKCLGTK
jgi:hypothetical protein